MLVEPLDVKRFVIVKRLRIIQKCGKYTQCFSLITVYVG